jgi:hypothetical protein
VAPAREKICDGDPRLIEKLKNRLRKLWPTKKSGVIKTWKNDCALLAKNTRFAPKVSGRENSFLLRNAVLELRPSDICALA